MSDLDLASSLPPRARDLVRVLDAPPRLIAHLALVHQVAGTLTAAVARAWPAAVFDREAILLGAATHDIGKAVYPDELTAPGRRHENDGPALLVAHDFSPEEARFARTHGQWAHEPRPSLDDLLVALADTIWKGKRNERLENLIIEHLATASGEETWETFMRLDDILEAIAADATLRLTWELDQEEE